MILRRRPDHVRVVARDRRVIVSTVVARLPALKAQLETSASLGHWTVEPLRVQTRRRFFGWRTIATWFGDAD
jgi:hypothetical protein